MTLPVSEPSWLAFTRPSTGSDAVQTLPIDRSREFREYDYPRRPGVYTPLDHFIQRYKEPDRFLTDEVVRTAITEGKLTNNGDGCACFQLPRGGVTYYLIAGFHNVGYRIMITGWPWLHDRDEARYSGEWSSRELDAIEALNNRDDRTHSDEWGDYTNWATQHT